MKRFIVCAAVVAGLIAGPAFADPKLDAALCKKLDSGPKVSITALLKKGADVNADCGKGQTPLMQATAFDNIAAMKALLDGHADVTRRFVDEGWTATFWLRSVKAADLLVSHGADVNAKDNEGAEPIGSMTETLMDDSTNPTEATAAAIAEFLIAHGADVNAADNDNMTALMKAASGGKLAIAQVLLNHNADVSPRNNIGAHNNALDFAINGQTGFLEPAEKAPTYHAIEMLLRAHGATQ